MFPLVNCDRERNFKQESQGNIRLEHISFDELQNRIGSTKAFSKSESYIKTGKSQTSTKATDDDRYELLTDEVLMIDLEESTHFTLKLIDNQSELISEFYNFIFTLDKATNHVSSQIVRYIPNKDWLNDPSQPYNGYIKMLDSEIFTLDAISKTSSVSKSTVDTYLCIDNVFYYWRCNADNPHSPEDYMPGGACRVGGNTLYINFTWTFCTTDSDLEGVEDSGFHTIYDPYNTGDTSGGGGGTSTVPELPQETIDKLEALEVMVQTLRLNDDEVDFLYDKYYTLFRDIEHYLVRDKYENGGEENTAEAIRLGNDIIDSAVNESLITPFPFFKYPPNSNYDTLYPKLTEYLKNQLPKVAEIPLIVDTIKYLTGLTESQIKEDLKWGKGPIIHITQLDNFSENTSDKTVGRFEESEPDVLHLDIDYVNKLENSTASQGEKDAFLFYLGTTILHEYVHYGDFQDGVQLPFEEGIRFELYVYGENVNSENAAIILNRK